MSLHVMQKLIRL